MLGLRGSQLGGQRSVDNIPNDINHLLRLSRDREGRGIDLFQGVCYPDTDYGCYQAEIDGRSLEWMKDGESAGSGEILGGDALNLME